MSSLKLKKFSNFQNLKFTDISKIMTPSHEPANYFDNELQKLKNFSIHLSISQVKDKIS